MPAGWLTLSKYSTMRPAPHRRLLMNVGGESGLLPLSPFDSHCTYWSSELTATTTPSQSGEAMGVRTAITAW